MIPIYTHNRHCGAKLDAQFINFSKPGILPKPRVWNSDDLESIQRRLDERIAEMQKLEHERFSQLCRLFEVIMHLPQNVSNISKRECLNFFSISKLYLNFRSFVLTKLFQLRLTLDNCDPEDERVRFAQDNKKLNISMISLDEVKMEDYHKLSNFLKAQSVKKILKNFKKLKLCVTFYPQMIINLAEKDLQIPQMIINLLAENCKNLQMLLLGEAELDVILPSPLFNVTKVIVSNLSCKLDMSKMKNLTYCRITSIASTADLVLPENLSRDKPLCFSPHILSEHCSYNELIKAKIKELIDNGLVTLSE